MDDYQKMFDDLKVIIETTNQLKRAAYRRYTTLVDSVLENKITGEAEIERIMDGLMDYGDDTDFLELYRKLCRHVYYNYPALVGEHVALFRALFMTRDEDVDE